mmetsp:Transcript_67600/g.148249  ORF Transcript_67600/g.148249 Transcript_67600/m.148249 type:complete len:91 (-) Transcript_67600:50-322(-)
MLAVWPIETRPKVPWRRPSLGAVESWHKQGDDIDAACHSAFQKGDWVFSRYYKSVHKDANALEQCNFGGAAVFSSPKMYQSFADPACIAA